MRTNSRAILASLLCSLHLSACSPDQNWREVGFDGAALKVQLPCKPDRTTRSVPLGGVPVDVQVAGCESGDAMVAVMTALLPAGANVQHILTGWQKATLSHLRVNQPLSEKQQKPWLRTGFLPLSSAIQVQAEGQRANGQLVTMHAVWGAVSEGDHVRVVHAVVYDKREATELASTLFEGIRP